MKSKWKIILPAGLIALALVSTLGWRTMVRQDDPGQVTANPSDTQQTFPAEETPDGSTQTVPDEIYTLPPVPSTVPKDTADPEAVPSSSGETVTVEEDGTIVIIPDWQEQIDQATKIETPGSEATVNLGGGGGELDLGDDGVFHGSKPTPPPAAPQQPGSIQPPTAPSPAPTAAPVVNTPVPVESSTPEATPAPAPSQGSQEGNGPPSWNGTKDGQMSPDGQYMWIGGFGWIERGGSNGGIGGQIDDSDRGWAPGEGGETVGTM